MRMICAAKASGVSGTGVALAVTHSPSWIVILHHLRHHLIGGGVDRTIRVAY